MEKETGKEGLRFENLQLENFKGLSKTILHIGGHGLLFIGPNGAGKSTLIDALESPLDTKRRPSMPIKQGETHASLEVTLKGHINGVPKQYILELYFSPKNQTGRLVITDTDGNKVPNPASFVKGLIGTVSYDIMEWLTGSKAEKLTKMKELTGIAKDIDIAQMTIKDRKEERKRLKERTEDLEAVMGNHGMSKDEIDTYSYPVSLMDINQELAHVEGQQQKFDGAIAKLNDMKKDYNRLEDTQLTCDAKIIDYKKEIERLQSLVGAEQTKITIIQSDKTELALKIIKGDQWAAQAVRPSGIDVATKMSLATAHNAKHEQVKQLALKQKEVLTGKNTIGDMDMQIKKDEAAIADKIKNSQLPIEGLSFDEHEIYLNGIPLEDKGINTAKLMETSALMAIYQAKKSNLKAIFIRDASLMDRNTLKGIITKIEEAGLQPIVELVAFDGQDLEVQFTEEYFND